MVSAATGTGDGKSASCQPDADSLVKVTWPSRVPLEGPQAADVGAGVPGAFVEANARDPPVGIRRELHAQVHRARVVGRSHRGLRRAWPDAARTLCPSVLKN